MEEQTERRSVISSSGWGLWVAGAIGIALIIGLIYGVWRLWRATSSVVTGQKEPSTIAETVPKKPEVRFIRTPTEIIVIDDPIIPEGETALEDILDTPLDYLGKSVVISGVVGDFESSAYFQLVQDEDQVTIMSLSEVIKSNDLDDNTTVTSQPIRVTGTVKRLTREIEKKGFGLELKNLDEAFWQDQIVIEAINVTEINGLTT